MRIILFVILLTSLAACGGNRAPQRGAPTLYAEGPISRACLASDRKARSRALCGCVQALADRDLTAADRRLAATFWKDPQRAQDMRQSDNPRHEAFWRRYKAFGNRVGSQCRAAA